MGLVSVIIPTYNRKRTLKRCVDSVLSQTYRNFEIIIVDDCSTDGTMEFIEAEYGNITEIPIIYVRNDTNLGVSVSRNVGISYANGEYIAFQDSDTQWVEDKLEKQIKYLNSLDASVAMVYSPYQRIYKDYSIVYPSLDVPLEEKSGDILRFLLDHPLVDTPTMLLRKAVFLEVGGFDTDMKALVDYELSIRIAQKYQICIWDEVLLFSYNEEDSISNDALRHIRSAFYLFRKHRELFNQYDMAMAYLNQLSQYALRYQQLDYYTKCLQESFGIMD